MKLFLPCMATNEKTFQGAITRRTRKVTMKQYILGLSILCGLIVPLGAMNQNNAKVESITELLENYMTTTVSAFLLRLSAFVADKGDGENTRAKKVVHEVIDTIKFGVFPIKVRNNPNAKLEDFFDTDKLKVLFKKMWEHHEQKKMGPKKFHKYIELFRKSLRFDKIQEKVGPEESADLHRFLVASERYYKQNNDPANIDNFIGFDRLPAFLDTLIKNYVNLEHLKVILNNQLNKKIVTKEQVLDCIKFMPLLIEFNCPVGKRSMMDQGIRGLISLLLDWAVDDKLAAEKLMRYIGNGYLVDRVAEVEIPAAAPAPASVPAPAPNPAPVQERQIVIARR